MSVKKPSTLKYEKRKKKANLQIFLNFGLASKSSKQYNIYKYDARIML